MNMVGHSIYDQKLLLMISDYTSNIFINSFFYSLMNKALPSFYRKNQMNIELGIGISHLNQERNYAAPPELNIKSNNSIEILPRWGKNSTNNQACTEETQGKFENY